MYSYGRIYGCLSPEIQRFIHPAGSPLVLRMMKAYFSTFGYPDVAGHMRYPLVLGMLEPQSGERILDAGCGNGIYTNSLASYYGVHGIGIDMRLDRLATAQRVAAYLGNGARFLKMDVTSLSFPATSFDKVLCVEVLEHIVDDRRALVELSRVLKPGGRLVLTIPRKKEHLSGDEPQALADPQPLEHVRGGYHLEEIRQMLISAGVSVYHEQRCFHRATHWAVQIQEFLYKRGHLFLNVLTFPALLLLSAMAPLNNTEYRWHRGYLVGAEKPSQEG